MCPPRYNGENIDQLFTFAIIDSHEPDSLAEKLKADIQISRLRLKYGDYSFSDVIIERKTLADFFSSLKNKRLIEQIENMSRFYSQRFLIIEGFFDFSYVNNLDYLNFVLTEIIVEHEVKIIFSKDLDFTAGIIKKIYDRGNLGYDSDINWKIKRNNAYHAVGFFGVGRKKLELLFSEFGNIGEMANAKKKEFRKISGVGKRTVEKVKKALEENIFVQDD